MFRSLQQMIVVARVVGESGGGDVLKDSSSFDLGLCFLVVVRFYEEQLGRQRTDRQGPPADPHRVDLSRRARATPRGLEEGPGRERLLAPLDPVDLELRSALREAIEARAQLVQSRKEAITAAKFLSRGRL